MGCCGSSPEPVAHRAPPDDEVDSEKKARLEAAIRARQEAEERAAAETAAAAFDQPGRAALAALPPHLRLGITLPGMRERYAALPADAVDQVNAGGRRRGAGRRRDAR